MEKLYEPNATVLKCSHEEIGDLWYAVIQQISSMELSGSQGTETYIRLKEMLSVFEGTGKLTAVVTK